MKACEHPQTFHKESVESGDVVWTCSLCLATRRFGEEWSLPLVEEEPVKLVGWPPDRQVKEGEILDFVVEVKLINNHSRKGPMWAIGFAEGSWVVIDVNQIVWSLVQTRLLDKTSSLFAQVRVGRADNDAVTALLEELREQRWLLQVLRITDPIRNETRTQFKWAPS